MIKDTRAAAVEYFTLRGVKEEGMIMIATYSQVDNEFGFHLRYSEIL